MGHRSMVPAAHYRMKILTISGEHSGVGKTTVAEFMLRELKGWSALKVTVVKEGPCPRKVSCGVCKKQKEPYTVISLPRILNQKGKDTQRMKAAGAKKVLWLKAKPSGLREGIKNALGKLSDSVGVVIEGTSVLKYLKPDVKIFVTEKNGIKIEQCS